MAELAYFYHFQPSELWDMDTDELLIWYEQAVRIHEQFED
jgi:hypothetical protein